MRFLFEMNNFDQVEIKKINESLKETDIKNVWTVYDEEQMWNFNQFNPFTGEPVKTIDDLILSHNNGVSIEDCIDDWNVNKGMFHLYSRVVGKGSKTKVLIETN